MVAPLYIRGVFLWYELVSGGSGGIRTHETLASRDLANRCHRPLGDTSNIFGTEKRCYPCILAWTGRHFMKTYRGIMLRKSARSGALFRAVKTINVVTPNNATT